MTGIAAVYDRTLAHFLAPIGAELADPDVTEILINGPDEVFVERRGRLTRAEARFADSAALEAAARNIAQFTGKRLVPETASVEARLPDGSRVHIVQPPAARKGLCVSIRKFSESRMDLAALVERGAISPPAAEFLSICVASARNLIVSGGTGSGKTTLLNALSGRIDPSERIIVLEDSSELRLQQEHVVAFESQPADRSGRGQVTIRDLFRASLRMRPDRVVVGECRGGEALDMIQAMTSGHAGSLSTLHANSPDDALHRLETMALMGGIDLPLVALRGQIASAVDVIVQIARLHDGTRRITRIAQVAGLDDEGRYRVEALFTPSDDTRASERELRWTGQPVRFANDVRASGMASDARFTQALWAHKENESE